MDFIGMRISEQEQLVNITNIYGSNALLYDQRFREGAITQNEKAFALGLVSDPYELRKQLDEVPHDVVSQTYLSTDKTKLACSIYLAMEPQNIAFVGDGLCQQRRESFRHWLAVKTSLLRFGPRYFSYDNHHIPKLHVKLNEHHHHSNPSFRKLFKAFVSLPKEVVFDSKLAVQFGLPVIAETTMNSRITEEWLCLMSWWHTIISELHPTLCELQAAPEKSKQAASPTKFQSVSHLRVIFDQCSTIMNSFPDELNNFLTTEYAALKQEKKNLPSLKITNKVNIIFLKSVMQFTANLTRTVIVYLVNVIKQNSEECLAYLESKTESYIIKSHTDLKELFRHRYMYSIFEVQECRHYILRHMEILLKKYSRRKFNITSVFGGMSEVHQRTIYRLQKFIRCIMNTSATSFIEAFCKYYNLKMKKEYAKRVMKSLILHITWTSMNIVLNVPQFPTTFEEDQKILILAAYPLKITDAETLITSSLMYQCVVKICEAIHHCDQNIFAIRPQTLQRIKIPVSYVYEDFPYFFMVFSEDFGTCAHPIMNLHTLTEGRIRTFMTQMMVCLHNNMPAIDQVLQNAKKYLQYKEHMQ